MPITEFQKKVLRLLKAHRNPNSYVAGGIAIHRSDLSTRHSNDVDFFHDIDEAVVLAAQQDRATLIANGYQVQTLIEQPSFVRVVVSHKSDSVKLEWVRDTAFRFFPVLEDDELGYRLHDVDLAVNKCLALANRVAVRDIIDVLHLHETVIPLAMACFAACGKDPGFTPELLLSYMRKNSIIRPEELDAELLVKKISAPDLKQMWMSCLEQAEAEMRIFPAADIGCVYLDSQGQVLKDVKKVSGLDSRRHFGSVGGAWPR